jgi:hypothetical protein
MFRNTGTLGGLSGHIATAMFGVSVPTWIKTFGMGRCCIASGWHRIGADTKTKKMYFSTMSFIPSFVFCAWHGREGTRL